MKILYVGVQKENYDPRRRDSFEYVNFYQTLKGMSKIPSAGERGGDVQVIEHPFDRVLEVGKEKWNEGSFEITSRTEIAPFPDAEATA